MKFCVRNTSALFSSAILLALQLGLTAIEIRAAEQEPKRVFVLNSFNRGYTWTDNMLRGIDDAFDSSGLMVERYITFMDMKRIPPTTQYFAQLKELIRLGYSGVHFDAVLACDNDALEFMRTYRDELFPGVPLVFSSINDYDERMLDGRKDITGTSENTDYAGTIRIALQLLPTTNTIVVVTDNTTTGKAHRSAVEKIRSEFPPQLAFVYVSLADLTLDELGTTLSRLDKNSIVLLLQHFVDKNGKSYSVQLSTPFLTEQSSVPVFVTTDIRIGFGALGGEVVSGYHHGAAAAQMVVKILNGADAGSIPVMLKSPNKEMFDYRAMQRFNIPERDLPVGSIVINKPVSLLDEYRPQLFAITCAFLSLSGLLVYLLVQIRRRKQAEETLRESEERLRMTADAGNVGLWDWDLRTNRVHYSSMWKRQIGFEDHEMSNDFSEWQNRVHPDDRDAAVARVQEFLNTPFSDFENEFRLRHKDGSYRTILARASLHRDENGNPNRMLGSHFDITDRKLAEEALRESESHFRALFEKASEGIIYISPQTDIVQVNESFAEMHGYTIEQMRKMKLQDLDVEDQTVLAPGRIQRLINGEDLRFDVKHYHKDGHIIDLEVSTCMISHKPNYYFVAFHRDITERLSAEQAGKRAEEALRQAQKMESIGTLAGGIAHDFNNLLNAVLGQSTLALGKLPKESPAKNHIDKSIIAAERATDLTRQLLAYSGKGKFITEEIDLNRLVNENIQMFETSVPKVAQLRFELVSPSPRILCDVGQIQQVIMNLIINAGESMGPNPGCITVYTRFSDLTQDDSDYWKYTVAPLRPGKYAQMEVSDNGCGMSQETLTRIFDPFFSTKFTGRGLGLAAVLGIIRGHNGGVRIKSEEGKGTQFAVVFPLVEVSSAVQIPEAKTETVVDGGGKTILVIDDEPSVLELLTDIFTDAKYTIISASNPMEGIKLYRQHRERITAVILDYSMPDMDGKAAFEELVKIASNVKVLLCSGYTEEETASAFGAVRPSGFIQKPYKPAIILDRVTRMISEDMPK